MEIKQEQITRGEFFKCCALSACSLVAITALPAAAQSDAKNPEVEHLKGRLDQMQVRHAAMLHVLEETLDEPTRKRVLEGAGRECARQFSQSTWGKYQGRFDAFLRDMQGPNGWFEKAEYDEKNGVLTITDRSRQCSCPLVKQGTTPAAQCLCTIGWQKETYSRLLGKPVDVSIVKSILRGDDRCTYQIRIL